VLTPALPPGGEPSHAYLFHGPYGSGKRTVARAFAAALLAQDGPGAGDNLGAGSVAERVAHGAHPDLTWIVPSGAREMLVGDIDEALVASIARTPFESTRRVFVIEDAHTMSDGVANRLLKTLEEPPSFAHIILLAQRPQDVLATVASRCQPVRFDALAPELLQARLREQLQAGNGDGNENDSDNNSNSNDNDNGNGNDLDAARLAACARLAQGDARLALQLAGAQGEELRAYAERFVRGALWQRTGERQWLGILQAARAAGTQAGAQLLEAVERELELMPAKERRRAAREASEAQKRVERRERTGALAQTLRLAELWLRDVWLLAEGAAEAVYAVDRMAQLREDAAGRTPGALREGVELIARTRLRLQANVAEELALETLAYQLEERLGRPGRSGDSSAEEVNSGATRRSAASRRTTTAAR
jgi:DNA polymerase III subunit delta'